MVAIWVANVFVNCTYDNLRLRKNRVDYPDAENVEMNVFFTPYLLILGRQRGFADLTVAGN